MAVDWSENTFIGQWIVLINNGNNAS